MERKNKHGLYIIFTLIAFLGLLALTTFLAWFITNVTDGENTFAIVVYVVQIMYAFILIVLIPVFIVFTRKREKDIKALTSAIKKVGSGDYKATIEITNKSEFTPVYEDFNKMCAELDSVAILRNDFINNYSHEFKTPIASINGFASLLLEKEMTEEERKQYLEIIVKESARLSNLAHNTILLSKLSAQQIITGAEEYELSEQLRNCSIILSKKWLDKKIEFNGEFTKTLFVGNKETLQHLWLNLLDNAIKYTPIGGEITVKNYTVDNGIIVEISDTGAGMDETTLKRLFDPYYQADTSHSCQGLGLGLSIAKRIVELYNGTISVQSELSVGSTFTVFLPTK